MLAALTLCIALAKQQPPALKWPAVAGGTVWFSRGSETKASHKAGMPAIADGLYSFSLKTPEPNNRAAVEFLTRVRENGPVVKFGAQTISFEDGHLSLTDGPFVPMPAAKPEEPLDLVFVTRYNDVAVYTNGAMFTSFPATAPTRITFLRKDWKTSLVGLVTYANALSPGQIKRNAVAADQFAKGMIAASSFMTLDLQLGAFTPVPDPAKIKPYRNALLAQEYKVVRVVMAGAEPVKPGDTVRVFRYGVLDGQKTAVKDLKAGDHVRIRIDLLSAHPALEREYQLDSLDTSYGETYVEIPDSHAGDRTGI